MGQERNNPRVPLVSPLGQPETGLPGPGDHILSIPVQSQEFHGGSCPSLEKYNLTNCSGIPGWVRRFPQAAPTEVPSPPRQPWPSPEIWDEHERGGTAPGPLHRDINSQELQSQPGGDSASCPQPCRGADNQQPAVSRWHRHGGHGEEGTEMLVAFGRDGHSRGGSRPGRQLAYG